MNDAEKFSPRFVEDVAEHVLTVEHDDGVFRSLHFGKPGTSICSYRLVTWSGHICISGDMGCYVLTRLRDMFEFCRASDDDPQGLFRVSVDYWAEKVVAMDRYTPTKRFSPERFEGSVRASLDEWIAEHEPDETQVHDLDAAFTRLVATANCDGEVAAREELQSWNEPGTHYPLFHDTWEWAFDEWTDGFLWCCCAIRWGIAQYDKRVARDSA